MNWTVCTGDISINTITKVALWFLCLLDYWFCDWSEIQILTANMNMYIYDITDFVCIRVCNFKFIESMLSFLTPVQWKHVAYELKF